MVVERRWSPLTKRIAFALVLAGVLLLLWRAGEIVPPFVWAFVVGYVLLPAVGFFEKRGLRRGAAAATVFLILLAAIAGVLRLVAPIAVAQLHELQRAFPSTVLNAQRTGAEILRDIGLGDLTALVFPGGTQEVAQNVGRMVVPLAQALGRFALELLVFLIAVFFVLRDAPRLFESLEGLVPRTQRAELLHIGGQVGYLIRRYIRGQLILVLLMATVTGIGLSILKVPYSVLLGSITGVLELIPIVGPITAGALAALVALGHPSPFGWTQLWYVGAVVIMYTVLRQVEDYVVVPLVIGRIVRLHPAVVIFSVLAGGALFGLLGVILAVPVAATLRLVLIYVLAKLRDEDPLAQLTKEIEATDDAPERAATEARAIQDGARP
ncbi:MAG: AI-2E family transporter [Chloroflexota bacterium]|nr:AI-2E family transporter [Chloroflexota bacterium]